jgi:hypothetical protein
MSLYVRGEGGGLFPVRDVAPGPDLYEKEIEDLAWSNLELFAGEALFPLGRQVVLPGGGRPDILALDSVGRVVVIEVKRDVDRQQLSQALEYAGWAYSTNLDEVAALYSGGVDAFFGDWSTYTGSATPVVVNHAPRLLLIARDIHPRTRDALRFLADSGLPVSVVPVSLYEDEAGRRLVDIERESEVTAGSPTEHGISGARSQKTYMIHGHVVRVVDLVEAGLLPAGTEIELGRGGKTAQATITEEGNIRVGEKDYSTPSGAGTPIVGHSVDGWITWRVPLLGNRTLADLRTELLDRVAEQESS